MSIDYKQVIFYCSHLSSFLDESDFAVGFEKFKNFWESSPDIEEIINEDIFKTRVITTNINHKNNELIHQFILDKVKNVVKTDLDKYIIELDSLIFKSAISSNHLEHVKKYLPVQLDITDCLQMSIKYGAYDCFDWFVNQYIPTKQQSKIIQWSTREFWHYHSTGYGSINFIKKLVNHPLNKDKPLKQDIYNMIKNYEFDFLIKFLEDDKCLDLLKEINVNHFYNLLFTALQEKKDDYTYNSGIALLMKSYEKIPTDFSQIKLSLSFKKNNPDILNLINKFILKETLDLLPEKNNHKRLKI